MPMRSSGALAGSVAAALSLCGACSAASPAESARAEASSPVTPQDFLRRGEALSSDAGPAIRRALASGRPVRFPAGLYVVRPDPASRMSDGHLAWSVRVPSGARLAFDVGATIKAAPGLRSWTRVVSFQGATNIKVTGELRVDASVDQIASDNNEHMHGIFLFNTTHSSFERLTSVNARGDNIYIGGTDNSRGTHNVSIGSIRAARAGRKNLVLQASADLRIGDAELDNREGGARLWGGRGDDTDGHSLDVEPDSFTGKVPNDARIGRLLTLGSGNDFTAGISATASQAWVLSIGNFDARTIPRAGVAAWVQYGISIKADRIHVSGLTGVDAQSVLFYAGRLDVGELEFGGRRAGDYLLLLANVAGNRPRLNAARVKMTNPVGGGLEIRNAEAEIGQFTASTRQNAIWNRGLPAEPGVRSELKVREIALENSGDPGGSSSAILITGDAGTIVTRIDRIRQSDTRQVGIRHLIRAAGGAATTLSIGSADLVAGTALLATAR